MRTIPESDSDLKELERLKVEPWMPELLKRNPQYTFWGPGEDYMKSTGDGWDGGSLFSSWKDFKWGLDELNELVNFYFKIERDSERCEKCDQTGLNPATKKISDEFYDFDNTGKRWCDNITQDEVEALQEAGRLLVHGKDGWIKKEGLTAEEVNQGNRAGSGWGDFNHDAINRWVLIETRAKRLGVYGLCKKCEGHGHVFTAPAATVTLVLWIIHPRKGCSRGVEVKNIKQDDLPDVFKFLRQGALRNAERFSKIQE